MILTIVIIGIVVNFICLGIAASKEPNGAMGMQIAFLFCFIPYLFPILFCVSKIIDFFGAGN